MRKFAAFDIDGTIFRWQLYHELFDRLSEAGHIDGSVAFEARRKWQERSISYDQYEQILVGAMNETIVGTKVAELEHIADEILEAKGSQIYTYTLNLLNELKAKGYVIIAISGSHQQLVDRFCELHGIDIGVGRNHVVIDGRLTADVTATIGRKHEVIKELVSSHDLTYEDSYAIGDSAGDISMLELVKHPVAFNPAHELRDVAIKQGWDIVVERKSIAYILQKGPDGSYLLAASNGR